MPDWLIAACGPAGPAGAGALLSGMFVAGLVGSIAHCGPMCSGFVLGQVSERMARLPASRLCEMARLREALLLPYHLGRITTYSLLGMMAAGLGAGLWSSRLAAVALALAAIAFAWQGAGRMWPRLRLASSGRATRAWQRMIAPPLRGVDRSRWSGGLLLGLLLGLLPCSMLYSALLAAAASGTPWLGAAGMAAFGMGTVPLLAAVGYAGERWMGLIPRLAPALLLLNAGVLGVLALRMGFGTG